MAMSFQAGGTSWVPANPWDHGTPSKRVKDAAALPDAARKHLGRLPSQADEGQPDRT